MAYKVFHSGQRRAVEGKIHVPNALLFRVTSDHVFALQYVQFKLADDTKPAYANRQGLAAE